MVAMSAERLAARRKANQNNPSFGADSSSSTSAVQQASSGTHILHGRAEDNPNHLVYKKMEAIVQQMQDEGSGVPVRTVKSFMSKVPSVFTGADLVAWILKNQDVDDHVEALHLAHQMSIHGYIFPIDDHVLSVRNDATFYRFQTPYFWPSNSWEPENTEYAVYLCKRTMQNKTRLELADYEGENLARLQKIFSRKWEFIFMQAEAQSKVDKKRDKLERKILDSQERAFWDVHRPVPGCVNTTELDIKKACRTGSRSVCVAVPAECGHLPPPPSSEPPTSPASNYQSSDTGQLQQLTDTVQALRQRIDRCSLRLSKVAETLISYYEQYLEYDAFLTTPDLYAPWISDSTEYWELEKSGKDVPLRRVKRWAFSLSELLRDPLGREQFVRFLDKEFSSENLRFYLALQDLRTVPLSAVPERAAAIWSEFLAADATYSVNIDSRSFDITKKNMEHPDRRTFEAAGAHLFHLMKSDSYSRYLRSDMYHEFLSGAKKKVSVRGIRSIVPFAIKKDSNT